MVVYRTAQQAAANGEPDLQAFHLEQRAGAAGGRFRQRQRFADVFGGQQALGIGVLRPAEQQGAPVLFHAAPLAHDRHVIRQAAHDIQVMGDEQQSHAHFLLQLLQQLQDLRLNGHVEGGGGFVGDQQLGPGQHRHGDHHPLAFAAGELVRIIFQPGFGTADADPIQTLNNLTARRVAPHAAVQHQHFRQLFFDVVQRIERHHGFLKYHRYLVAAHFAQLRLGRMQQRGAVEADIAAGIDHRRDGSRRSTDSAVTLLPEPDSPTNASVSACSICSDRPLTTGTSASPCRKATLRS